MEVSTLLYGTFGISMRFFSNYAAFVIPALLPQNSYTGPSGQDNGDLCKCNTVTYNLISACAACQEGSWITCVDGFWWSYAMDAKRC